MKIAIIGWGYLIWDPLGMDLEPEWFRDGPLLPVEFARFDSGPRLLPVLVEGAPLQPTLWTYSRKATVLSAAADLAVREGVWTHDIGHLTRAEAMGQSSGIDAVIGPWVESKGLDGAVWRAVEPNLPDMSPGMASAQAKLEYLKELVASGRAAKVEKPRKHTATPTGASPSKARNTKVVGCRRRPGIRRSRASAESGAPSPIGSLE